MKLMRLFFFLLAFSLMVQNTCTYGFAGKTAFAAFYTHDCPYQKNQQSPDRDQDSVGDKTVKMLYPAFLFSVPDVQRITLCFREYAAYTPLFSDSYKDPFKKPTIKPPVV